MGHHVLASSFCAIVARVLMRGNGIKWKSLALLPLASLPLARYSFSRFSSPGRNGSLRQHAVIIPFVPRGNQFPFSRTLL